MKKLVLAVFASSLLTTVSHAQDTPKADVAAGYSVIQVVKGPSVTAYGGSSSITWNVNNWLGAVGDFALYHASPIAPGLAAGTYTFGPRFSYRHWGRFTPFAQVLLGGVRYADNAFAFGSGGGADIGLDRAGKFALRPQVGYFGFRVDGSTANTVRLSVRLVYRFGRR